MVGLTLGSLVGVKDGFVLGLDVGSLLGFSDGVAVGSSVGFDVGVPETTKRKHAPLLSIYFHQIFSISHSFSFQNWNDRLKENTCWA